jgi:hypothetical protein
MRFSSLCSFAILSLAQAAPLAPVRAMQTETHFGNRFHKRARGNALGRRSPQEEMMPMPAGRGAAPVEAPPADNATILASLKELISLVGGPVEPAEPVEEDTGRKKSKSKKKPKVKVIMEAVNQLRALLEGQAAGGAGMDPGMMDPGMVPGMGEMGPPPLGPQMAPPPLGPQMGPPQMDPEMAAFMAANPGAMPNM